MAVATAQPTPRREDIGDLIVLNLHGSYRDMGRQQVELLGPLARDLYDVHRSDWAGLIASFGPAAKLADAILPRFWMTVSRPNDDTNVYDEILGIGDGLGVSAPAAWRGVFGTLGGATTTFAATGSATVDGSAILAKNSDWPDRYGKRPPLVVHYHPTNGDLAHVIATWPLCPLAPAGMNESGFSFGLNFFNADQVLSLGLPKWPYRRALQTATTVAEGMRIIEESPNQGISGFVSMADAEGGIGLMECTPGDTSVVPLDSDWFAQSNHARTEKMIPHDRGRSVDSFTRREAMEAAVVPQLGKITPQAAPTILRDRSNSEYLNESTVANLSAFHSIVMHPASRTLWHSTARQPFAAFGELAAFTSGIEESPAAPLPPDPRYGTPDFYRQVAVVADLRRAMQLFDTGSVEEASAIWDGLAGEPLIEPHRLAWARARAGWSLGRLEEATDILGTLDGDEVPFDVRANALTARAMILDRMGRREDAVETYGRARNYLEANSQYNDGLVSPLRKRIEAGIKGTLDKAPMPGFPGLQRVPA